MPKLVLSLVAGAVLAVAAVSTAAVREDSSALRADSAARVPAPRAEPASLRVEQLIQASQLRAYPVDQTLIARRDVPGFPGGADGQGAFESGVPYSRPDTASALPVAAARELGVELPRPGRLSATLATLALGLFFFLRRIG